MGTMTETPGELLRRLRVEAGYRTQKVLATAIADATDRELTDAAVSEWERNNHVPSYRNVVAADELLGAGGQLLAAYGFDHDPDVAGPTNAQLLAAFTAMDARNQHDHDALVTAVTKLGAELARVARLLQASGDGEVGQRPRRHQGSRKASS